MARRSTPQRALDDRTFPIRIQFELPWNGYGARLDVYLAWLRRLDAAEWAWHSTTLYCRKISTAEQFLANFPELLLADGATDRKSS